MSISTFLIAVPAFSIQSLGSESADSPFLQDAVATASLNYTYHSYSQIKSEMLQVESQHSAIAKVFDIGDSWEKTQSIVDRDILAIKISDNVIVDEDEPEVLVVALHHAREWITTEIAVGLAQNLTDGYGTDPRTSWLVDNREVWIVPVVNPDGLDYSLSTDDMWRKNMRLNADLTHGVDLNRNYDGASNGDPLGDWGGAGASTITSSEVYCGSGPFSEPETQAIRDLVVSRNFTIAVDVHSFGGQVLWPWGYTGNQTADDVDLSRIGHEIAAENGYLAWQSSNLYPTTGDSIDWMYGYAGIFAFAIEVGGEFHPANSSVVAESVALNVNATLKAIEVAGDRQERMFTLAHATQSAMEYSETGYLIVANVQADRGVDNSTVALAYSLDGLNWTQVAMGRYGSNDTYYTILPSFAVWDVVDYYFMARDEGGVFKTAPDYGPYEAYTLVVTPPAQLIGGVDFTIPDEIDGTVGWTFDASVEGYPRGFLINLGLNSTNGGDFQFQWRMENGTGTTRCAIGPGLGRSNYSARLFATIGGYEIWSSSPFSLSVVDRTPPTIVSVNGTISDVDAGRLYMVVLRCADVYGPLNATMDFSVNGGRVQRLTFDFSWSHSDQNFFPWMEQTYSCGFLFTIPKQKGYLDYRINVSDSSNVAEYPEAGNWTRVEFERAAQISGSSPPYLLIGGIIAAAVVAVVAVLLIRERRRRASAREDTQSRSQQKQP